MRQQSSKNMRRSFTMQQDKLKTLQILPILLFIASLAGCSSSAKIRSDYDPGADFASYKTWDFIEDAGPDHEGYESLFSQYMVTAITLEMDKRGYTRSNNPDLLVNFNAYLQDKTKVTTTPSAPPMGGYYGYRGAYPRVTVHRGHVQYRPHRCEAATACLGSSRCWTNDREKVKQPAARCTRWCAEVLRVLSVRCRKRYSSPNEVAL